MTHETLFNLIRPNLTPQKVNTTTDTLSLQSFVFKIQYTLQL